MRKFIAASFLVLACISSTAAFTIGSVISNVTCNGTNNGSINITPAGGTSPYTFSWSNGKTTEDIDSLIAGTYTVTVTDALSVIQTGTYTVTQPSAVLFNGTAHNAACYNGISGSIDFNVSQGTGPYSYTLNGGAPVVMDATDENFQWVRNSGGTATGGSTSNNKAAAVATDKNGNVFVTGEFYASLIIGGTTLTSAGNSDIFIAKYSKQGSFLWAQRIGGSNYDSGFGIATDTSGNVLITGRFRATATFGSFTLTATSGDDVFVAKYDAGGNCTWVTHPASTNFDIGWGITTDAAGNSYVVGYFGGTLTFSPLSAITSPSGASIFTVKIDVNGVPAWVKRGAGSGGNNQGSAIALDHLNNVYITGYFSNSMTFGSTTVTSVSGSNDFFMTKYNNAGTEQWVRTAGNTYDDYGMGICVDNADNVYATGYFKTTVNFGSGPVTGIGFSEDIFLVKFNPAGTALWTRIAGGTTGDHGNAVTCDQFNNVYITGYHLGAATFGSFTISGNGFNDLFVAKYNSSGTELLVKNVGGSAYDEAYGICSDKKGSVYVGGFFGGSMNFGSIPVTSAGVQDIFVSRFSTISAADTLSNLPAGNYSISVSDFNGCTTSNSFVISEPAEIIPVLSTTSPLCYGGNGTAAFTISGGVAPFTTSWGSNDPNALPAGNYPVTITDNNGCDTTVAVIITQPSLITVNALSVAELCYGQCNGSAYVTATGGTGNHYYLWNTSSSNDSISGVCPGNYTVIVTDDNNCRDTTAVTIQAAAELQVTGLISNASCGNCNGSATLYPTGGSPGYSYLWCNGNTAPSGSGLCAGTCLVMIADNNGCTITDTVVIGTVPALSLSMSISADTVCNGMCSTLDGAATGGSPTYTYLWSPGASLSDSTISNPVACPLMSTSYSLTVTDLNGCTVTDSQVVHVDLCTGIAEQENNRISAYPNPFSSVLHLNFGVSSVHTICVYNSIGVLVMKRSVSGERADLETESWDKGIYLLQISDATSAKTTSIIKD